MNTLEIIHLRLAGDYPESLVDAVLKSVRAEPDPTGVRIYRHSSLGTDLAVHLHRDADHRSSDASDIGMRLASLLREYGMVEHAVWVEAACGTMEQPTLSD